MAIIVYSIPNCPRCAAAKALLKRNSLVFQEIDVSEGKKTVELSKKLENAGISGEEITMPVLDIDGAILQGFEKEKIVSALKQKGFLKN